MIFLRDLWYNAYIKFYRVLMMKLPLTRSSRNCKVRLAIRFLVAEKVSTSEFYNRLCKIYGENFMLSRTVHFWVLHFLKGREGVHDKQDLHTMGTAPTNIERRDWIARCRFCCVTNQDPEILGRIVTGKETWIYYMTLRKKKSIFQRGRVRRSGSNMFKNLDGTLYRQGIEKLVSRYDKCLTLNGNYVEKKDFLKKMVMFYFFKYLLYLLRKNEVTYLMEKNKKNKKIYFLTKTVI